MSSLFVGLKNKKRFNNTIKKVFFHQKGRVMRVQIFLQAYQDGFLSECISVEITGYSGKVTFVTVAGEKGQTHHCQPSQILETKPKIPQCGIKSRSYMAQQT